jgi:hypothetical protein
MTASVRQPIIDPIIFHFASDFKNFVEIPEKRHPFDRPRALPAPPNEFFADRIIF